MLHRQIIRKSQSILKGKVEFDGEEWTTVSKEAKNLIMSLICKPEKRLTADEALQHKWMKKNIFGIPDNPLKDIHEDLVI